jgi:hypothetical protein
LKSEARILITTCSPKACIGLIIRGAGVDGAVGGKNCEDMCKDFSRRGYQGETRFAFGDCICGLRTPPSLPSTAEAWARVLSKIISDMELYLETKPCKTGQQF